MEEGSDIGVWIAYSEKRMKRRGQIRGTKRQLTGANTNVRSFHFMIDGRCEQLRLIILLYSASLFEAIGCVRMCVRGSACMWGGKPE